MPTLEQIKDKMKKLQEQAEKLIAKRAESILTDILKLMEEHGLTTSDIAAHSTGKKQRGRPAGSGPTATATRKVTSHSAVTGVKAPKYRHPKTGATWTGHGRAPAWIADAKDRSKFLIDVIGAGTVSKTKTAAKKSGAGAHTGQRKGPQPAKYLDPKTGAKWSGRGPAPAWLAVAKDRSKFLIAGADTGSADVGSVKVAGKKATAKKVAVTTKPAAKKVPAKKAVTAKTAGRKVAVKVTQKLAGKK
jgi:DNA-binding protein H-NS